MNNSINIMIVEDERIVAEDLKRNLETLGYSVQDILSSGEGVLKQLEKVKPDLILMDVVLNGKLDGIETTEIISSNYSIPIVYLTAYADKVTLEKAKRTQPYGYLIKPFAAGDLRGTIEMAIYKHQMEQKLRERETWLETTLTNIADGVITTDFDGQIKFMNHIAEKHTGFDRNFVVGKSIEKVFQIIDESSKKKVQSFYSQVLQNKFNESQVYLIKNKDGQERPVNIHVSPITNDIMERKGTVFVFHDISSERESEAEKKRMREQLLQSQKMEAIGKLAGGIAHDFNTLLTAILGSTDIAMLNMDNTHASYSDLKEVQIAAGYAADLTRQLLLFSRKHPMKMVLLNLNHPIEDMLKLLHRVIGEDVKIKTDLSEPLWAVRADRGTLEQVLMNLVVNAREAMPNGGRLFIRTENVTIDEPTAELMRQRPGRYVCISMEDTGIGMDTKTMDRIFEPFFSTKGPVKGTGLGLSVVYGIIQQHEGWIHVYSELNKGTVFKIYIPAQRKKLRKKVEKEIEVGDIQGHGERILVVEDGKGAREFTKRALSKNGYQVFAASNAAEAIRIWQKEKGKFDLVFSDVELPEKTGIELVEELNKKKSGIRILMCSGYTDQETRWPIIEKRGYRFLQKPYGLKDLLRVVMETLKFD